MAATTSPSHTTQVAARGILDRLRFLVRSYVLAEGTAVVLAVMGAAFWVSFLLDRTLELPVGWRIVILVAAIVTSGAFLLTLVLQRLFRDYQPRSLALILEKKYPQFDDRLITTVELAEDRSRVRTPLTESMLAKTADELRGMLSAVRLGDVFNMWPLVRAVAIAVLLLLSIGTFAAVANDSARLWFRRNVLLKNEFWPRETDLIVKVLADPGERVMPFRNGLYKHPQGQNLSIVAEVPEGKVVPDQVQLVYRLEGGGGATENLARVGDRSFRFTLSGLQASARLWFYGGDYSSRRPLVVQVVAPPQINRLRLEAQYPRYTGKSPEVLTVSGSQVSLPAATEFALRAETNKPMHGFRIESETFTLDVTKERVVFRQPPDGPEQPWPVSRSLLSTKGTSFVVPCVLATKPAEELAGLRGPVVPLRLPPTAQLSLFLHDVDDVMSVEPTRLTVNSMADEPPSIRTELRGVGSAVTRQATIPVQGTVQDDYGVVGPRFDFRLDAQTSWEPKLFAAPAMPGREVKVAERFEVLPLDLKIGQKLTLTVSAGDAYEPLTLFSIDPLSVAALPLALFTHDVDDLTGPHRVQGDRYSFEVVTNEELLAQIAARELNLRQRFEQIISEVEETRRDLQLQRSKLDEWRMTSADEDQLAKGWEDLSLVAERSVSRNAKNRNETISIEESFADVSLELKNNAVPNIKEILQRIDDGVVGPLHLVNTKDYVDVDEELTRLKGSIEVRGSQVGDDIDACVSDLNVLDAHLKEVLAQMLKIESYNEALQLLREIIQSQEELKKKTQQEQKRDAIKRLQQE